MFIELQLEYLLWLQNLRTATADFFTPFFLFATKFGEYLFPIITCAIIYWCTDKKLGIFIMLSSATSLMFNHLLKNTACIHRPWMMDNNIKPVDAALRLAGGYSFPSGHSALAGSCWGAIALWYKNNKKCLILFTLLCLLVAFSRNYLGVHTLQDIIAGLLTSFLILILFYKALNWCEQEKHRDLIITLIVSLISIFITAYTYFKAYPLDYDSTGKLFFDANHSKISAFPKLGLVLGAFWGWFIERRLVNFDAKKGSFNTKIIRAIIGIILLIMIMNTSLLWKKYCNIYFGGFGFMLTISLFITLIYPWFIKIYTKKHYLSINR